MSRLPTVSCCLLFLLLGGSAAVQADATLRYNYDYVCNKERIVVGHCRHDSDSPDFPPTQPQDDYCQVYYPDRPKTGGFEAMGTVLRGDLVKTLETCGAFGASSAVPATQPARAPQPATAQQQPGSTRAAAPAPSPVAKLVQSGMDSFASARKLQAAKDEKAATTAFASAAAAFQQALNLDPASLEALRGLGGVNLFSPDGDLTPAIDYLKKALALRQDDLLTLSWLGQAYLFNDAYLDALATFERAAALQPRDVGSQFNLGYTYAEVGRYDDAWRIHEALLPLDKALADELSAKIGKSTQLSSNWSKSATPVNPKIELVSIAPGSFTMGAKWPAESGPVHQVSIADGFFLGKYEVTQDQWQMVMGANPSFFKKCGGTCPVEQVSWNDAQEFINRLNALHDGYRYRLPSEAEWEYAYRAGTTSDFYAPGVIGWSEENSGSTTHPVGGLPANAFGLYDMAGNVAEWCLDIYRENYDGAPVDGSAWLGADVLNRRVVRNASFYVARMWTTADHRMPDLPEAVSRNTGLRVAASK